MTNNKHSEDQLDPFSRLMFGKRKSNKTKIDNELNLEKTIEKHLEDVDVNELLKTIDLFMTSTKQLKPLFNKISPFISDFIKKNERG